MVRTKQGTQKVFSCRIKSELLFIEVIAINELPLKGGENEINGKFQIQYAINQVFLLSHGEGQESDAWRFLCTDLFPPLEARCCLGYGLNPSKCSRKLTLPLFPLHCRGETELPLCLTAFSPCNQGSAAIVFELKSSEEACSEEASAN